MSKRFTGRPTLEEFFADVTNEGLVTTKAYQAYWGYAYSLAEIGRFLDLGRKRSRPCWTNGVGSSSCWRT